MCQRVSKAWRLGHPVSTMKKSERIHWIQWCYVYVVDCSDVSTSNTDTETGDQNASDVRMSYLMQLFRRRLLFHVGRAQSKTNHYKVEPWNRVLSIMPASAPDAPINLILNQRMDQMDSFTESNYAVIRLRRVEAPTPRSNLLQRDWVSSARAATHLPTMRLRRLRLTALPSTSFNFRHFCCVRFLPFV